MTPEEIIRRVADQSTLFCFEPDELDAKGKVVKPGKKITNADVGRALDELLSDEAISAGHSAITQQLMLRIGDQHDHAEAFREAVREFHSVRDNG